jgi:hypothetical protein
MKAGGYNSLKDWQWHDRGHEESEGEDSPVANLRRMMIRMFSELK